MINFLVGDYMEMQKTESYQSLGYYLELPWTYTVEMITQEGKLLYSVRVNELPKVVTRHVQIEEAMEVIKKDLAVAIMARMEEGEPIPVPMVPEQYKGNIAYRTSKSRHYTIAKEAKMRGISLSKVLDECVDMFIQV